MENKLSKGIFGSGVLAGALLIAIPFVTDHEGESLKSYQDVVGVYTICNGETAGVKPGMKKTQAECEELTKSQVGQFMRGVAAKITFVVQPQVLAAHTSFAYNIGIVGYARSSALALTNAGDIAAGCRAMRKWITAGGKDCRVQANGCYGLVRRRDDEVKLCLSGAP